MRIALDVMGGDHAPAATVQGAVRARDADAELQVILVGDQAGIEAELGRLGDSGERLRIVHASQVIACDESPADALRRKRDSSVVRAFRLVQAGEADAVVSAGNTGAVVGAGQLICRLIPGIRKAGIAVVLGSRETRTILIDVGANIYCKPLHLLHYGMMASVFAERVLGTENPRVALLNIGSEEAKGNSLVRETRELFASAPFNFIGHVEGNDLFRNVADVVVCEGFVGNVVLKVSEGLSEAMHVQFEEILEAHGGAEADSEAAAMVARFRRGTDYAEVGGAPLLGVNGTCIIAHGRSDARAIGNALRMAARFGRARVVQTISQGLEAHQAS